MAYDAPLTPAAAPRPLPPPGDVPALRARYLKAALRGDRKEALRLLVDEGLLVGLPLPTLMLEVLAPAQHEVGRLWQENRISVAQEHMATAVAQLALAHLYRHLAREPDNGRRVTLACVEGELHDLGARMASDFLEAAGFGVHFLGASVPLEHLVRQLREEPPHLLALSATMSFHLPALRAAVKGVRAALPGLPVAVGGWALEWSPGLAEELGVTFVGRDARELVRLARQTLGV